MSNKRNSSQEDESEVDVKRSKYEDEQEALSTLQNIDIKKIMSSDSEEVKCVLLKADGTTEECLIDMSPRKKLVQQKLGGQITFLGQWEDLEVILIISANQPDTNSTSSENAFLLNKHKLQPPFHNTDIYGDILLTRSDSAGNPKHLPINEYTDFTKKVIEAWEPEDISHESEEEEDDEEDEDDEDGEGDDDEDDSENDEDFNSDDEDDGDDEDDEDEDFDTQQATLDFLIPKLIAGFVAEHNREPTAEELDTLTKRLMGSLEQKYMDDEDEDEEEEGSESINEK